MEKIVSSNNYIHRWPEGIGNTFLKKKMIKLFTLLQPKAAQKPLSSGVVETLIAYKKEYSKVFENLFRAPKLKSGDIAGSGSSI